MLFALFRIQIPYKEYLTNINIALSGYNTTQG